MSPFLNGNLLSKLYIDIPNLIISTLQFALKIHLRYHFEN